MLQIPAPVEPTIADPPAPSPRDAAWASYVRRASDALKGTETIAQEAVRVIEQGGSLDEFNTLLSVLGTLCTEIGEANAGLHALSSTSGVA